MATPDDDDARFMELETLEAIFPEIRRPSDVPGFVFELELPVRPAEPVTVLFPAAEGAAPDGKQPAASSASSAAVPSSSTSPAPAGPAAEPVDSLLVSHLPPVSLRIVLPDGYPADKPPQVSISTTPQWLSRETLASLEGDGPRLWEEAGRDMVAYSYIDHVHRAAEDVFGAVTAEGTLAVPPEHKLAVLDYDIKAKRAAFEKETFECGICLDPKKGSKCHKMLDCGHIFCLQCLQDFYNDAITEGNLSTVRCLTPNCAKERAAAAAGDVSRRKPKTFISPSELLQIGLSEDAVKRYVTLKYKTELESDKDTIYCPRQWCNGAARSKKHKKPEGLQFSETPDSDADDSDDGGEDPTDEKAAEEQRDTNKKAKAKAAAKFNAADLLSVCEDCGFAFCSRCLQTWHGEFVHCVPKRTTDELTEEEKASLEYLQLHTSPCPTCAAPAQKTHGCNHMICSRCDTHFCYLCSSWLDPGNPYKHYNQQGDGKVTSCYMRLWELEGGDGNDVGIGFVGGRGAAAAPAPAPAAAGAVHHLEDDFDADIDGGAPWQFGAADESDTETEDGNEPPAGQAPNDQPAVAVAREAPLVLRLVDNQPRRAAQPAPQQPPPPAARGRGGRGQHHQQHQHHHGPHRGAARGADPRAGGRGAPLQRGGRAGGGAVRGGGRPARGANAGGRAAVARGGDAAAAAVAAPEHRRHQQQQQPQQQHHHQQQQQQQQGQQQPPPPGGNNIAAGLDPAQEAWVRRFVQMALLDEEDQVEGGDSDSDDENWFLR
ncbi:RING finger protein [Purpureocillium lilacinum]|uniref:RBR-type E3 ubiquitin transferase n=1 Tax=Purpureocillium lilacinum TaxID=33203 RepID=A0A179GJ18_PURLI|nr:RING finger protein [Purpureocillium lilacinum]